MPQSRHVLKNIFEGLKKKDSGIFYHEILWSFINRQILRSAKHYGRWPKFLSDQDAEGEGVPPEHPLEDIQTRAGIDIIATKEGRIEISFEHFEIFCEVFNVDLIKTLKFFVLMMADLRKTRCLKENFLERTLRLAKEAQQEIDFQKFKEEQGQ